MFYGLQQDDGDDSIRKILARPILVSSGTLGAAPTTVFQQHFANGSAFRTMFTPAQWDRMLGYHGIRFTLRISCVISKTAFHQGVVSLCFQYGTADLNRYRGLAANFPLSVHLPNVRLNLAEQTMMDLKVPFVYADEYMIVDQTLSSNLVRYGTFSLVNLTGCPVVAGQTVPRYSVYVSLEDVEFIGAQPFAFTTVVTQAGLKNDNSLYKTANVSGMMVSSGAIQKEAKGKGVISGMLETGASVARMASYVPGLSSVGGAADWFLRSASGAAQAFGYSKPVDELHPNRVVRTSYAGDGHTDMPTTGFTLAPFQSSKVAIDGSVGCNDVDEMALDYVLTKYSYIYRGNFTTTQVSGDTIYSAPVTPSAFWYRDRSISVVGATGNLPLKTSNTVTENAFLPSTLCYVGSNFRYWRGNLKFRVTFANTKLHGGRVVFAFVPYTNSYAPNTPLAATRVIPATSAVGPTLTGYATIFDLQDASEFEFEVPFVYPQPYCPILESAIGDVSISVVNPLTANAAVPTTVNFMVEVAAMPGFEFAGPCPSLMSAVPDTGQLAITYQSGLNQTMAELEVGPTASQECIGEVVKSVKSIMMMPDYITVDVTGNSITDWTLDPWFKPNAPALATPMPATMQAHFFAARSSRMAEMYAYVRGGTAYSVTKDRTGSLTAVFSMRPENGGVSPATLGGSFYDTGVNPLGAMVYPEVMESGRCVVPTYSMRARIPLDARDAGFGGARTGFNNATWNRSVTFAVPKLGIRNNNATSSRLLIGRAAADDAICSQFVGPPPVIIPNFLSTTSPYTNNGIGGEF